MAQNGLAYGAGTDGSLVILKKIWNHDKKK